MTMQMAMEFTNIPTVIAMKVCHTTYISISFYTDNNIFNTTHTKTNNNNTTKHNMIIVLKIWLGDWVMDKRHGTGTFFCKQDASTYRGGFVNGKKEGYGTLTLGCGHIVHGIWHYGSLVSIDNFEISPTSPWNNPDL